MMGAKIAHSILEKERQVLGHNQSKYLEPFAGGLNITQHIVKAAAATGGHRKSIMVCDASDDMVIFYKALKWGWTPPNHLISNISLKDYLFYKQQPESPDRTFVGLAWSKYGRLFGEYDRGGQKGTYPAYMARQIINNKYDAMLRNVEIFDAMSYDRFEPKSCVVYCDPPYRRTDYNCEFDTVAFWDTMRRWSKNNLVFVSEEQAPSDFQLIYSYEIHKKDRCGRPFVRTDCLFYRGP